MNAEVLKTRLNSLFARLNPPYGVVPEWHEAAAGEAEIRDTETRLGVCLPEDVKAAFRSFSGISHETPYLMSEHFETLRRKLAAASSPPQAASPQTTANSKTTWSLPKSNV